MPKGVKRVRRTDRIHEMACELATKYEPQLSKIAARVRKDIVCGFRKHKIPTCKGQGFAYTPSSEWTLIWTLFEALTRCYSLREQIRFSPEDVKVFVCKCEKKKKE